MCTPAVLDWGESCSPFRIWGSGSFHFEIAFHRVSWPHQQTLPCQGAAQVTPAPSTVVWKLLGGHQIIPLSQSWWKKSDRLCPNLVSQIFGPTSWFWRSWLVYLILNSLKNSFFGSSSPLQPLIFVSCELDELREPYAFTGFVPNGVDFVEVS